MNSDRDELYIKVVDLDKMYKFEVQALFVWFNIHTQIIDTILRFEISFKPETSIDYLNMKMAPNETILNYKVAYLSTKIAPNETILNYIVPNHIN